MSQFEIHAERAEKLLLDARDPNATGSTKDRLIATAQVEATLALAWATEERNPR